MAQVVEIVHSAYESLRIMDELIAEGIVEEPLVQPTKSGTGATAVERRAIQESALSAGAMLSVTSLKALIGTAGILRCGWPADSKVR